VRAGLGVSSEPAVSPTAEAVLQAVGGRPRARWRRIGRWAALAFVLAGGSLTARAWLSAPPPAPTYETVALDRGDIDETVQATGTLEARRVVSVGGEISGRIATVAVEVNDRVTRGQVLATLDPASLDNALTEAKGALAAAKIGVTRASATTKAAKVTKDRAESLFASGLIAREELETAQSSHTLAQADEARARSDRDLAAIRVQQAETDRTKATIVSPIDGVVLTRSVEPGNAISASLEAPELFLLAEDLSAMRLHLGVDEADVGRVQAGQAASFTVDAWPGRTFEAKVERVDLAPAVAETTTVVTYTAVLAVDNAGERLRPGMTATATIVTERHAQVLRVPTVALRFDPNAVEPSAPETKASNPLQPTMPGRRGGAGRNRGARSGTEGGEARRAGGRPSVLHVLRDGEPTPIEVRVGASDGRFTQIQTDALQAGDEVVVAMEVST
jgi:HlyD family secretion protein